MPAPKSRPKTELYLQLDARSTERGETNDCAVVAVAAVAGVEYDVAHAALERAGRKARKGTKMTLTRAALKELGYTVSQAMNPRLFITKYPKNDHVLKSVTTHHPDRFASVWEDGETYLFRTKGHILGVVDGTVHDHTRGKAMRCLGIYRVRKAK